MILFKQTFKAHIYIEHGRLDYHASAPILEIHYYRDLKGLLQDVAAVFDDDGKLLVKFYHKDGDISGLWHDLTTNTILYYL